MGLSQLQNGSSSIGYPSGFSPISTPSGMVPAFFDDFLTSTLNTSYWGVYSGNSEGSSQGQFGGTNHIKTPGDSTVHLQAFYDPAATGGSFND